MEAKIPKNRGKSEDICADLKELLGESDERFTLQS